MVNLIHQKLYHLRGPIHFCGGSRKKKGEGLTKSDDQGQEWVRWGGGGGGGETIPHHTGFGFGFRVKVGFGYLIALV